MIYFVPAKAGLYVPTDTHRHMMLKNLNCTKKKEVVNLAIPKPTQECETKAGSQKQGLYSALTLQRAQQTGEGGTATSLWQRLISDASGASHLVSEQDQI